MVLSVSMNISVFNKYVQHIMAKLIVDTGTAGNPATGDTLRTAMTKVNTNFTELYDSELLSLSQGLLKTVTTNGDIKIQPNGTGQVEIDQLLITSDSITSLVTNGDVTLAGNGTGNVIIEAITIDGTTLSSADSTLITVAEALEVTGAATLGTSLTLASGATVTGILDEDAMGTNSATQLATQQSIKAYVDSTVTAQDLDVASDSGTAAVDLDSQSLTVTGGTGIGTTATGQAVTVNIDATVATLVGSQTLTNKILTSPTINNATIAGGTFSGTFTGDINPGTVTTNEIISNGSNADLTLDTVGTGDINLTAGADVNIPANIGMTFGDDGEKIEGDGTDLTISSSNEINTVSAGTGNTSTLLTSAGGIYLDANGNAIRLDATTTVNLYQAATLYGSFNHASGVFELISKVNNGDLKFKGQDDGSEITALTLDMSEAGTATFNHDVILPNNGILQFGDAGENIAGDGTQLAIASSSHLTLDANATIILDSNTGEVSFKDDGTTIGFFLNESSDFTIRSAVSDKDLLLKGNDGGSTITALTLDMSEAGAATFNSTVTMSGGQAIPGKIEGTNFTDSLLIGHSTTGTLDDAQANTGVGIGALDSITSADSVTAIGNDAAQAVTSGGFSTVVGAGAYFTNSSGTNNTAIGRFSLRQSTGSNNVALGKDSGEALSSGNQNIIIGSNTGDLYPTTGSGNVLIGSNIDADASDSARTLKIAGYDGTTTTTWISGDNTGKVSFPGNDGAGLSILSSTISTSASNADITLTPNGTGSVVISQVSTNSVTGEVIPGKIGGTNFSHSLLVGHATHGTLSSAERNTGVGIRALESLTTADGNVAVGNQAGKSITTSIGNTMIGKFAGDAVSTGVGGNVYVGSASGLYNVTGQKNVGIGTNSLLGVSGQSNSFNTGVGTGSLQVVTTGVSNIGIGNEAGDNITSGDGNVIIGSVDADSATADKQLKIADGVDGTVTWIQGDNTGKVSFPGGDGAGLSILSSTITTAASNADITLTPNGTGGVNLNGTTTLGGSFAQAIHTFVATDAITVVEHAGRILLLGEVGGNADVVLTLPDATGSGNVYEFIVSVTMASNTYKIACPDADNTITGQIQYLDEDGTAAAAFPTVAASDTITLNGGTQGGLVGDTLTLIDIAANKWMVKGLMRVAAGANPATPFSAAVS
jgi:hypothetical protein